MDKVDEAQVLERKCIIASPKPEITSESRRYLKGESAKLSNPPEVPPLECRVSESLLPLHYWKCTLPCKHGSSIYTSWCLSASSLLYFLH